MVLQGIMLDNDINYNLDHLIVAILETGIFEKFRTFCIRSNCFQYV